MTNQIQNPNVKREYDLAERIARLGEAVIEFARSLPENIINKPLISQLVRSGTSVGANYMEADVAESKKDFLHKIGISKKEVKETLHWFRMIAKANPDRTDQYRTLWQETHELVLIFSAITRNKPK